MSPRLRRLLLPLALAAALLACQDEASRIAGHKERGEAYLEEEKFPEAGLEFRSAVQIAPNDAEAHWGLARAYLGEKDVRKAYWELQEAVRLDPANLEAQLQLGQFLLYGKQEELERAIASADAVLAEDPERAAAWVLRARALAALQRDAEATEAYAKAVEVAPEDPGPLLLLANHHRQQGRTEEAERLFATLTEVRESFATWAARAGFLATQGAERADEAEAGYQRALELATDEERRTAYTLLANFYIGRERGDDAERVLREGIERVEDKLPLIYGLAGYHQSRGETEQAEAMLQEAVANRPDDAAPLLLLSTYRGRHGDLEGALEAAERALEVAPEDSRARLRRAEVLVDLGYRENDPTAIAKGRAVVDAVLAKEENNPEALFVKAKIDLAERRTEDALAALRRAIDARPDWAQAHYLLGSALLLQGDRAGARSEVARALELDANFLAAERLLARIHASMGDHALAVETGRRALAREDDASTRVLVAQSLVRQRRLDEALAELDKIPEEGRGAEEHYALGRVHVLAGDREQARAHFEQAAAVDPHRYEILRALLDLDMREDRLAESAQRIAAAQEARPDDARLQQLHGEAALYGGRAADAEASFRRAIELDPNDLDAYQRLARLLALTGRTDEVVATYERAIERNPDSATLHLIAGSLYELKGRQEEAMARYENAIRLDPGLAVAKNNLAYLIAERGGNLDRAYDLAQEAKALLPENPNTADTLGWVLYKKRVPEAAIAYLREAEGGMAPDDPQIGVVRHHLALAYEAAGQPEAAREVLERALRDLESQFGSAEAAQPRPEPPWAADLRSMHVRLTGGG